MPRKHMEAHTLHHLTADQLAARWCVSAGHLANLRCEGRGPAYLKLGARVAYRLADVEEYEADRLIMPERPLEARAS